MNYEDELALFPGRTKALQSIIRYNLYPVMLYRTNLCNHARRLTWILDEVHPIVEALFPKNYSAERTHLLALIHDDAEIITGDVQAGNKSKMTSQQLRKVKEQENRAIEILAERFPKHLGSSTYKDLLIEATQKRTLESQLVSLADKFDALCEAVHEVVAGNYYFVRNISNEYGQLPTPTEYYLDYLENRFEKFPLLHSLFTQQHWLFQTPPPFRDKKYCEQGKLHTRTSIQEKSGYLPYDEWKKILIKRSTPEQLKELYLPSEKLLKTE